MRHRLDVLRVLTTSDLRVRYGRGRLRFLKWVLDPLAALGVYLLLVSLVLARGEDAIGLSLACAVVPFTLLMASTVNALTSVQLRGSILLNMGFPRMLIPIASVTTETIAFTASLVLLPVMMIIYDVGPTLSILWLPVALAITVDPRARASPTPRRCSGSGTPSFSRSRSRSRAPPSSSPPA